MTKKKVFRNFGGWKSKNVFGKRSMIWKIFHEVWQFFWKRGNPKQRGNASLPQGDGRPWR